MTRVAVDYIGAVVGSPGSSPSSSASSSVADEAESTPLAASREHLVIVLEGGGDASVASIVPARSILVSTERQSSSKRVAARQIETIVMPSTLAALRELVRARDGDVLLLTDPQLLTPSALDALRGGLVADSACATVSLDNEASPCAPGHPPPGTIAPRDGAVLVRRDHLILALDEAELLARADVPSSRSGSDASLISQVVSALARPGFLHRVVSPFGEALPASTAAHGLRPRRVVADVVLDGRCLGYPLSGTQVQLFGLVSGLARAGAHVAVMLPAEVHPSVTTAVQSAGTYVPFVERSRIRRPAIFHRPFQMWSLRDLADCLSIGERLVLTHQDMILDRTPEYTSTIEGWNHYRQTTRAALSSADEIAFFSQHAATDAASDGLVNPDRSTVVPLGVDHLSPATDRVTTADPFHGRPYLVVLGNSYWHKNRLFAVRLLQWLVERDDWDGGLVLAGGDTGLGSSVMAEAAFCRETPSLRDRVTDLGLVSEADRAALYQGAELVLFPSMYEGFGLDPLRGGRSGNGLRVHLQIVGARVSSGSGRAAVLRSRRGWSVRCGAIVRSAPDVRRSLRRSETLHPA